MPLHVWSAPLCWRAWKSRWKHGLTVDGWVPVDFFTLETAHRDVYALGDCTSVGTPKAGVFSEGQARIAASERELMAEREIIRHLIRRA